MDVESIVRRLLEEVEHRYYGKYRGLVMDNEDPLQLGRLRVQVPSVLGEEVVTGWAMPCAAGGGSVNEGLLFVPPAGAGVWVEFEEGDLQFPIWVGTFWSAPDGESEVPVPRDGQGEETELALAPTAKLFKSAKGHTLQLEDADDAELVTLVDGVSGHRVVLSADGVRVVDGLNGNEVVLNDSGVEVLDGVNGHRVVMDGGGLTLSSQGNVTISGNSISISGTDITIGADTTLALSGTPVHLNP